jgi:predicted phosphodiesterase
MSIVRMTRRYGSLEKKATHDANVILAGHTHLQFLQALR